MSRKAAFFDRDGVLNVDHGYVFKPEQWEWQEGAKEAIRWCNENRYLVVVITNQSGIGRGYYTEKDLEKLHGFIQEDLKNAGARIDAIYHCPHLPEDNCSCRKPLPGMILQAIRDLDLDPARSFLIGDNPTDIEAAQAAGIKGVLYSGGDLEPVARGCNRAPVPDPNA
ncbi:MAG: D-glycero-alpha-D-manno-heptose-1,7-bisphosphate 7-phosphatase [Fimbriimonas sp.]